MKLHSFLLLGALAFTASVYAGPGPGPVVGPAPAPASDAGLFIGVDAGPFWLQQVAGHNGINDIDLHFKTGWGIEVPIGWNFGNGFALRVNSGYNEADFDSATAHFRGNHFSTTNIDGKVKMVPILAEGAWSVNIAPNFHWYIGVGAGTVDYRTSINSINGFAVPGGDNKWVFGFDAFTGLAYDIAPHAAITLGYRYMYVNQTSDNISGGNGNSHLLSAGVLFRF